MSIIEKAKELIPKVKEVIDTYNKGKEASVNKPYRHYQEAPYSHTPFPTFPGDEEDVYDHFNRKCNEEADIKALIGQLRELTEELKKHNDS